MENSKLKTNQLNFFEVIAMSVAIMAPTFAMASNTPLLAGVVGYSFGLVFLFTMIAVGLVSISFIKFNQYLSTAGSVYSFTTASLGKNVGIVSGWAMTLTYLLFSAACCAAFGSFSSTIILELTGIEINWIPLTLICCTLIWLLSFRDVTISTKVMLVFEGIAIILLLILSIVVIFKVGFTTGLSIKPFQLNDNSMSGIGTAVVFGFLSFAGFEGASSLGEESKNPKKYIPLAIIMTIIIIGIFYIIVSYAQVVGFGLTTEGITALSQSTSPLTTLSHNFLSGGYSLVITLCAAISAFSCALGAVSGCCRVIYSMSKDSNLPGVLSKIHTKHNSPYIALHVVMVLTIILDLVLSGNPALTVYGYFGTIGSLSIILCYLITVIGSMVYFKKKKVWKIYHLILPLIGGLVLLYTFFINVYPVPSFPFNIFPYVVLGVLTLGTLGTFVYKKKFIQMDKNLKNPSASEEI